jgi:hypothetical protein
MEDYHCIGLTWGDAQEGSVVEESYGWSDGAVEGTSEVATLSVAASICPIWPNHQEHREEAGGAARGSVIHGGRRSSHVNLCNVTGDKLK